MTCSPAAGWVEEIGPADGTSRTVIAKFHARTDCPRIHDPGGLRPADWPATALRCMLCTGGTGETSGAAVSAGRVDHVTLGSVVLP